METRLRMFAQGMTDMLFCGRYVYSYYDESVVYSKAAKKHLPFIEYVAAAVALQLTERIFRSDEVPY